MQTAPSRPAAPWTIEVRLSVVCVGVLRPLTAARRPRCRPAALSARVGEGVGVRGVATIAVPRRCGFTAVFGVDCGVSGYRCMCMCELFVATMLWETGSVQ